MALKQSISGIRGIWGKDLDYDIIIRHIDAFITELPETGTIVIGRDTRPSGKEIVQIIIENLAEKGYDVLDAGINPTPTIEIATAQIPDAIAGIIVTASHNPPEYNGLKFLNEKGMFMAAEPMKRIIAQYNANFRAEKSDKKGEIKMDVRAPIRHIDRILAQDIINKDVIIDKHFRVLYDANDGAGATVIPPLLKRLGCDIEVIGGELSGEFSHSPIPNPENLAGIGKMVIEHKANIGLATDPDADRLALIDENGIPLSEELTLAIVADFVLDKVKSDITINLSTSSIIDYIAGKHGIKVHRTPVGEINVSSKMFEIGAKIGGEGNGGAILADMHPGRDAGIAAALILAKMAESEKMLSEIVSKYPDRFILKDAIEFEGIYRLDEDELIKQTSPIKIDKQDGLWLGFDDGFLHIRPSNTEPILRIIAEKKTKILARELIELTKGMLSF
ncbi:MAG: phosphoglucosamine mutase [Candidatus Zixiibacteriota bacterium]